jgi:hypothetical protein
MLRHQLRQDLVLGLDLLFQILDALLLGLRIGPGLILEGRRSVLEELLLPPVEDRWLQAQFLAELGDRFLVQQMPSQNSDCFAGGVVLPYRFHAFLRYLNGRAPSPFPTGAEHWNFGLDYGTTTVALPDVD